MTEQTGLAALDLSPAAALASDGPELRVAPSDATISANRSDDPDTNVARRPFPALKSAFIHGSRLLWAALLYGAAGLTGWLVAEAAWPTVSALPDLVRTMATQESAERAAFLRTTQKMEEDIRALRAEMVAMRSLMRATPAVDAVESLGKRIDAMKTETRSAIGALSSQVEGLQRDVAAKPAQTGARLEQTERAVVERVPQRTSVSATVRVSERLRRAKIRRGDVFESSKYPDAPGAPRPLGTSVR